MENWTTRPHNQWPRLTGLANRDRNSGEEAQMASYESPYTAENPASFYHYSLHPDDIATRGSISVYSLQHPDDNKHGRRSRCRTCFGTMLLLSIGVAIAVAVTLSIMLSHPQPKYYRSSMKENKTLLEELRRKESELGQDLCELMATLFDLRDGDHPTMKISECRVSLNESPGNLVFKFKMNVDDEFIRSDLSKFQSVLLANVFVVSSNSSTKKSGDVLPKSKMDSSTKDFSTTESRGLALDMPSVQRLQSVIPGAMPSVQRLQSVIPGATSPFESKFLTSSYARETTVVSPSSPPVNMQSSSKSLSVDISAVGQNTEATSIPIVHSEATSSELHLRYDNEATPTAISSFTEVLFSSVKKATADDSLSYTHITPSSSFIISYGFIGDFDGSSSINPSQQHVSAQLHRSVSVRPFESSAGDTIPVLTSVGFYSGNEIQLMINSSFTHVVSSSADYSTAIEPSPSYRFSSDNIENVPYNSLLDSTHQDRTSPLVSDVFFDISTEGFLLSDSAELYVSEGLAPSTISVFTSVRASTDLRYSYTDTVPSSLYTPDIMSSFHDTLSLNPSHQHLLSHSPIASSVTSSSFDTKDKGSLHVPELTSESDLKTSETFINILNISIIHDAVDTFKTETMSQLSTGLVSNNATLLQEITSRTAEMISEVSSLSPEMPSKEVTAITSQEMATIVPMMTSEMSSSELTSTRPTTELEMTSLEMASMMSTLSPEMTSHQMTSIVSTLSSEMTSHEMAFVVSMLSPELTSHEMTSVVSTLSPELTPQEITSLVSKSSPEMTSQEMTYAMSTLSPEITSQKMTSLVSTLSQNISSHEMTYVVSTLSPGLTSQEMTPVSSLSPNISSHEMTSIVSTSLPEMTSQEMTPVMSTLSPEMTSHEMTSLVFTLTPELTPQKMTSFVSTLSSEMTSHEMTSVVSTLSPELTPQEITSLVSKSSPEMTSQEMTYAMSTLSPEITSQKMTSLVSTLSPNISSHEMTYVVSTLSPGLTSQEMTPVSSLSPNISSHEMTSIVSTSLPEMTSQEMTPVMSTLSPEMTSHEMTSLVFTLTPELTSHEMTSIVSTSLPEMTSQEMTPVMSTLSPKMTSHEMSSLVSTLSPELTSHEMTFVVSTSLPEMTSQEMTPVVSTLSPEITSQEMTYVVSTLSPELTSQEMTPVSSLSPNISSHEMTSIMSTSLPEMTSQEMTYVVSTLSPELTSQEMTPVSSLSPNISSHEMTSIMSTSLPEMTSQEMTPVVSTLSPEITSQEMTPVVSTLSPELTSQEMTPVVSTLSPEMTSQEMTPVVSTLSPEITSQEMTPVVSTLSPESTSQDMTYIVSTLSSNNSSQEMTSVVSTSSPEMTSQEMIPVVSTSSPEITSQEMTSVVSTLSPELTSQEITPVASLSPNIRSQEMTPIVSTSSPEITSHEMTPVVSTLSPEIPSQDMTYVVSTLSPELTSQEITPVASLSPNIRSQEMTPIVSTSSPEMTSHEMTSVVSTLSPELTSPEMTSVSTLSPNISSQEMTYIVSTSSPEMTSHEMTHVVSTLTSEMTSLKQEMTSVLPTMASELSSNDQAPTKWSELAIVSTLMPQYTYSTIVNSLVNTHLEPSSSSIEMDVTSTIMDIFPASTISSQIASVSAMDTVPPMAPYWLDTNFQMLAFNDTKNSTSALDVPKLRHDTNAGPVSQISAPDLGNNTVSLTPNPLSQVILPDLGQTTEDITPLATTTDSTSSTTRDIGRDIFESEIANRAMATAKPHDFWENILKMVRHTTDIPTFDQITNGQNLTLDNISTPETNDSLLIGSYCSAQKLTPSNVNVKLTPSDVQIDSEIRMPSLYMDISSEHSYSTSTVLSEMHVTMEPSFTARIAPVLSTKYGPDEIVTISPLSDQPEHGNSISHTKSVYYSGENSALRMSTGTDFSHLLSSDIYFTGISPTPSASTPPLSDEYAFYDLLPASRDMSHVTPDSNIALSTNDLSSNGLSSRRILFPSISDDYARMQSSFSIASMFPSSQSSSIISSNPALATGSPAIGARLSPNATLPIQPLSDDYAFYDLMPDHLDVSSIHPMSSSVLSASASRRELYQNSDITPPLSDNLMTASMYTSIQSASSASYIAIISSTQLPSANTILSPLSDDYAFYDLMPISIDASSILSSSGDIEAINFASSAVLPSSSSVEFSTDSTWASPSVGVSSMRMRN